MYLERWGGGGAETINRVLLPFRKCCNGKSAFLSHLVFIVRNCISRYRACVPFYSLSPSYLGNILYTCPPPFNNRKKSILIYYDFDQLSQLCVTSIPVWSKIINSYILKHNHNYTIYDNGKILASVKKSKCEFKQLLFFINCSLE